MLKKLAACVAMAVCATFLTTNLILANTYPPDPWQDFYGDADGDTYIVASDLSIVQNYINTQEYNFDTLQPQNPDQDWNTCDLDSDRACTTLDRNIMIAYINAQSIEIDDKLWVLTVENLPIFGNVITEWIPFNVNLHSTLYPGEEYEEPSGRPGKSVVVEIDEASSSTTVTGSLGGRTCNPSSGSRDQAAGTGAQCALSVTITDWQTDPAKGLTEDGGYGLKVKADGVGSIKLNIYINENPSLDIPSVTTSIVVYFYFSEEEFNTDKRDLFATTQVIGGADWDDSGNQGVATLTQFCGGSGTAGDFPSLEGSGYISVMTGNDDGTLSLAYELWTDELIPLIDDEIGSSITKKAFITSIAKANIDAGTIPDLVFGLVAKTEDQGTTSYMPFMGVVLNNEGLTPSSVIITDLGISSSIVDYRIVNIAQLEYSPADIIALVSTVYTTLYIDQNTTIPDGRCSAQDTAQNYLGNSHVARFLNSGDGYLHFADRIYPSSGTINSAKDMIYFKYGDYNYIAISEIIYNGNGYNQVDVLEFPNSISTREEKFVSTGDVQPFALTWGDLQDPASTPMILIAAKTVYPMASTTIEATRVLYFDPTLEDPSPVYISNAESVPPSTLYFLGRPLDIEFGPFLSGSATPDIALLLSQPDKTVYVNSLDGYCPQPEGSYVNCGELPNRLAFLYNKGYSEFQASENQNQIWDDDHPVFPVHYGRGYQMAISNIDGPADTLLEIAVIVPWPGIQIFHNDPAIDPPHYPRYPKRWGVWNTRNSFNPDPNPDLWPYLVESPFRFLMMGEMGDFDNDGAMDMVYPMLGCIDKPPNQSYSYLTVFWGCNTTNGMNGCTSGGYFVKDQCTNQADLNFPACSIAANSFPVFGTTSLRIPCSNIGTNSVSPYRLTIADFNKDGHNDILAGVVHKQYNYYDDSFYAIHKVIVFRGEPRLTSTFGNTGNPFRNADDALDLESNTILHFYTSGDIDCEANSVSSYENYCAGKALPCIGTSDIALWECLWRPAIAKLAVGDFNHDGCNDIAAGINTHLYRPDYTGNEPNTVQGVVLLLQEPSTVEGCTLVQEPSQFYPELLWLYNNSDVGVVYVVTADIDQSGNTDDIVSLVHLLHSDHYPTTITFHRNNGPASVIAPEDVKAAYTNTALAVIQPPLSDVKGGAYLCAALISDIDDDDCTDIAVAICPDNNWDYTGLNILWGQGTTGDCKDDEFTGFLETEETLISTTSPMSACSNMVLINDYLQIGQKAIVGGSRGTITVLEQVTSEKRLFTPNYYELGAGWDSGVPYLALSGVADLGDGASTVFIVNYYGLQDIFIWAPFDK